MNETHLCPRRAESPSSNHHSLPTEDTWNDRDGYPVCSWCGALKPEVFFECAEAGAELGPTDKNYKVYIDLPDPKAGQLKITGCSNAKVSPGPGWFQVTEADLPEVAASGWSTEGKVGQWMSRSVRGKVHGKFYFQHLSQEQRTRFIELLNARKLTLGYPGGFYILPYFIAVKP
jgi:hypothetical protein